MAKAIRRASPQTITHFGTGRRPSNRWPPTAVTWGRDGKISFGRTSATLDPTIRNQPEGLIDPALKTISFWNGTKPVAALHAYSTHPMSYYGKGDVSADFPGSHGASCRLSRQTLSHLLFRCKRRYHGRPL